MSSHLHLHKHDFAAAHHLERLPVVSDLQSLRLIGIISRSDLIKPSLLFFDEEQKRERLLS